MPWCCNSLQLRQRQGLLFLGQKPVETGFLIWSFPFKDIHLNYGLEVICSVTKPVWTGFQDHLATSNQFFWGLSGWRWREMYPWDWGGPIWNWNHWQMHWGPAQKSGQKVFFLILLPATVDLLFIRHIAC